MRPLKELVLFVDTFGAEGVGQPQCWLALRGEKKDFRRLLGKMKKKETGPTPEEAELDAFLKRHLGELSKPSIEAELGGLQATFYKARDTQKKPYYTEFRLARMEERGQLSYLHPSMVEHLEPVNIELQDLVPHRKSISFEAKGAETEQLVRAYLEKPDLLRALALMSNKKGRYFIAKKLLPDEPEKAMEIFRGELGFWTPEGKKKLSAITPTSRKIMKELLSHSDRELRRQAIEVAARMSGKRRGG